jgi:enoyl-[acyl-carrier protein] reductase I
MTSTTLEWKTDQTVAVGKGATVQQFVALLGADKLEISVAPWGEGQLKVNGREIAHVDYAKDRRQAFRELDLIAGRYLSGDFATTEKERRPSRILQLRPSFLKAKRA